MARRGGAFAATLFRIGDTALPRLSLLLHDRRLLGQLLRHVRAQTRRDERACSTLLNAHEVPSPLIRGELRILRYCALVEVETPPCQLHAEEPFQVQPVKTHSVLQEHGQQVVFVHDRVRTLNSRLTAPALMPREEVSSLSPNGTKSPVNRRRSNQGVLVLDSKRKRIHLPDKLPERRLNLTTEGHRHRPFVQIEHVRSRATVLEDVGTFQKLFENTNFSADDDKSTSS
mmetsp:Transcript_11538/g.31010  ORF Transcript_11538/g.31010 Transcript_11538/m.31010 type:complete len:229 (-) Transcript_11538:150-836(-)